MKKVTLVKTDDPDMAKFTVTVTGKVEHIADIDPRSVYLEGRPGDVLETTIKITPRDNYGFSIIDLKKRNQSDSIKAVLVSPEKEGAGAWQIHVSAASEKADNLYDTLSVITDSKYLPQIDIRVYAVFMEKQKSEQKP